MFLIGKLFLLLLKPLTWIIVLLLIGLFNKNQRRKKKLIVAGLIALIFFSNPFFFRLVAKSYETRPVTLNPGQKFEAGILLGGFISYNIKERRATFNPASDRFIQTALLYKNNHIQKIIIAAGNGYVARHDFKEAEYAKDRLVQLGIPTENILTDPRSKNTYENAVNTKKILDSLQVRGQSLLISSAVHLPRAQKLFKKQGLTVIPYPCDFSTQNIANNFWEDYLLPSSQALSDWDSVIKEWTGILIYKIQGKI
ncbi:MAG TPA: YdcF family protein [Chitinophagaceae bacterium]|nr:YdcF family protein [Chitinophagaceae bacterium]